MEEGYFDRHQENALNANEKRKKESGGVIALAPEKTLYPFKEGIIYGEKGEETINLKNGWTLEYSYSSLDKKGRDSYSRITKKDPGFLAEDIAKGKFRSLTRMLIKNKNGEQIDFFGELDPDIKIFFTAENNEISESAAYPDHKMIFSYAPPNSFLGLMVLLHEIGHMSKTRENLSSRVEKVEQAAGILSKEDRLFHRFFRQKSSQGEIKHAAGTILEEERGAWSIALKLLRPALNAFDVSREDISQIIHKMSLTTYSKDVYTPKGNITLRDTLDLIKDLFSKTLQETQAQQGQLESI